MLSDITSCTILSDFRRSFLFEGFKASTVCPSGKSNMYMRMSVEQWWHDTDKGEAKYREKKTSGNSALSTTNVSAVPNPGPSGQWPVTILSHAWPLKTC
jgi:hypothetical protein